MSAPETTDSTAPDPAPGAAHTADPGAGSGANPAEIRDDIEPAASTLAADEPTAETAEPEEPPYVPDRWRAGWGPDGVDPQDRREGDRRHGERRQDERRQDVRRADDRWESRARAELPAEPPPLRVPTAVISAQNLENVVGPGRILAVIVLLVIAFASGIAVDQATFRSDATAISIPVPAPTVPGGPAPTTAPAPTSAPVGNGAGASPVVASPGPNATPGPTIGPGATVPPNAPANIGLLWDALKTIQEHFVRRADLNPTDLTYGMINGLVQSLGDPGHTVFLTPDQVKSENEQLNGTITGIGVYLGDSGDGPFISSVLNGSPAAKAGLRSGDKIIAIDGQAAENLSNEEVSKRIRGAEGTPVSLTVIHTGTDTPVTVTIVRAKIDVPPVSWTMIPGTSIADIAISGFSSGTGQDFTNALRGAKQAGATGLILDLRNNPGGFVDEAVNVSSELLGGGNVYIRKTADGEKIPVPVKPGAIAPDLPMTVLVDYGTASSAEITAGALQDAHRARVIGSRTYGTGTVLNTFGLSDGSAVRLGVEEWLTPSGDAIFPNGIQPDQPVALAPDAQVLDPDTLRDMSADDIRTSSDAQLLRAMQDLTAK